MTGQTLAVYMMHNWSFWSHIFQSVLPWKSSVLYHCHITLLHYDFHSPLVCHVVSNRCPRYIFHSIDWDGSPYAETLINQHYKKWA